MTVQLPQPVRRTIVWTQGEPWFLGWCFWEIATDLHYEKGGALRTVLASGQWKWRGRKAKFTEITLDASLDWYGHPLTADEIEALCA